MHTESYVQNLGSRKLVAQSENDIAIITGNNQLEHFNGMDWYLDNSINEQLPPFTYSYGGDFKGDMVIIVGVVNGGAQAYAARGYRNTRQNNVLSKVTKKRKNHD